MFAAYSLYRSGARLRSAWGKLDANSRFALKIAAVYVPIVPAVLPSVVGFVMATADRSGEVSYSDRVAHECKTSQRLSGQPVHALQKYFSCMQRPGAWAGSALRVVNTDPQPPH